MKSSVAVDSRPFRLSAEAARDRIGVDGVTGVSNHMIEGDCLEVLPDLPDGCVDLIHTSPPYNIDKEYKDASDDRALSDYRAFLRRFIEETHRVLKPNGSIFFQTGYSEDDGEHREIFPIDMLTYNDFREVGFKLWDRIIWRYFGGMSFRRKFKNQHETILWWVRPGEGDLSPYFDVDAVREESKSYDKRNNLWGKNPGNIWTEDRVAYGSDRRATSHIAIYPESITERIVRSCSRPDELVLDPFAGSGTTPAVARSLGRGWIGIEVSPAYTEEACERIGSRQPSEWETLASGVIKCICFENRPHKARLSATMEFLGHWLNHASVEDYKATYQEQIERVFEGGDTSRSQNKEPKPDVWWDFDKFFQRSDRTHPVLVASEILDALYRHRRHWNSVRKYQHAVSLLDRLVQAQQELSIDELVDRIVRNEPSSYELEDDYLEFLGPAVPLEGGREVPDGAKALREQVELFDN